jgi:hypothetical protein
LGAPLDDLDSLNRDPNILLLEPHLESILQATDERTLIE